MATQSNPEELFDTYLQTQAELKKAAQEYEFLRFLEPDKEAVLSIRKWEAYKIKRETFRAERRSKWEILVSVTERFCAARTALTRYLPLHIKVAHRGFHWYSRNHRFERERLVVTPIGANDA